MLRISTHDVPESLTFQLEGRLAGAWVRELETCWKQTLIGRQWPAIRVDLTNVTFIDASGKKLLGDLFREGAELIAADCLTRAIVAEITGGKRSNLKFGNSL